MDKEILARMVNLVEAAPREEIEAIQDCDLHRLLVVRYLGEAMERRRLPEAEQRAAVRSFKALCAATAATDDAVPPWRREMVRDGLRRAGAARSRRDRLVIVLHLLIRLAGARRPRPMAPWPDAVPGEVRSRRARGRTRTIDVPASLDAP